jgi:hypothetical protein
MSQPCQRFTVRHTSGSDEVGAVYSSRKLGMEIANLGEVLLPM